MQSNTLPLLRCLCSHSPKIVKVASQATSTGKQKRCSWLALPSV